MKRLAVFAAFAAILFFGRDVHASIVIAGWTFETSVPTTAGEHAAEVGSGEASGFHASAATVYSNPVGNGSAESFSSNNWSIGDYYQFNFSTTGQTGIAISFDQTRSGTGPATFQLQYSTNGGASYLDFGATYTVNQASWSSGTPLDPPATSYDVDFGGLLDNVALARIRLTSQVSTAAAGTNRVDNVFITAVPEPSALVLLGVCLAPLALGRRRNSMAV